MISTSTAAGRFTHPPTLVFRSFSPRWARLWTLFPRGAQQKVINGTTYYLFGAAYYQPFYSGSSVIYQIVSDPTA
jgi:hypothetical protein